MGLNSNFSSSQVFRITILDTEIEETQWEIVVLNYLKGILGR